MLMKHILNLESTDYDVIKKDAKIINIPALIITYKIQIYYVCTDLYVIVFISAYTRD